MLTDDELRAMSRHRGSAANPMTTTGPTTKAHRGRRLRVDGLTPARGGRSLGALYSTSRHPAAHRQERPGPAEHRRAGPRNTVETPARTPRAHTVGDAGPCATPSGTLSGGPLGTTVGGLAPTTDRHCSAARTKTTAAAMSSASSGQLTARQHYANAIASTRRFTARPTGVSPSGTWPANGGGPEQVNSATGTEGLTPTCAPPLAPAEAMPAAGASALQGTRPRQAPCGDKPSAPTTTGHR